MQSSQSSPCDVSACPSPCEWTGSGGGGHPIHSSACKNLFQRCIGSLCSQDTGNPPICEEKQKKEIGPKRYSLFFCIFFKNCLYEEKVRFNSRSTSDLNTGDMVLETIRPQAWNILITHLHLPTLEVCTFIHANLVVLGVLRKTKITFI